ncbi:hypothetical protein [Microtetraspora malaysiensis]|uniref:hypothetical protein n=1 Tax=Microtetraspora malaysiensis TaxID=161358 RepID=UPI0008363F2F|nr:hypothetical protein [Microtetraspora malaysiensis]
MAPTAHLVGTMVAARTYSVMTATQSARPMIRCAGGPWETRTSMDREKMKITRIKMAMRLSRNSNGAPGAGRSRPPISAIDPIPAFYAYPVGEHCNPIP